MSSGFFFDPTWTHYSAAGASSPLRFGQLRIDFVLMPSGKLTW